MAKRLFHPAPKSKNSGLGLTGKDWEQLGIKAKFVPDQNQPKHHPVKPTTGEKMVPLALAQKATQQIVESLETNMNKSQNIRQLVLQAAPQLKASLESQIKSGVKNVDLGIQVKNLDVSQKMKVKNLAIGGKGGESLAIDELLLADIVDRAVGQFSGIFNTLNPRTFSSVNVRQVVERSQPGIMKGIENVAGLPETSTGTGTLEQVVNQVAKATVNTYITYEADKDTIKGDSVSLWDYLASSSAKKVQHYFTLQLIAGDGRPDNLRGLVSSERIDLTESVKNDNDRDLDFLQVTKSGQDGDWGGDYDDAIPNIIKFIQSVPSKNRANSVVFMNPKTYPELRNINSTLAGNLEFDKVVVDGQIIQTIEGLPIVFDDMMPLVDDHSVPLLAGDINAAIDFAWHDLDSVIDPYTGDGVTKYKLYPRASEKMKDNTALRAFILSA
ncbi:hypothetical protein VCHA38O209_50275 [Vibrio chagasii]|nr:hypothetical protein VCHA38O209_50275 [Vibrio chagasii]